MTLQNVDTEEDIFDSSNQTSGGGSSSSSPIRRPRSTYSMISQKLKLNEFRKKVLQLSMSKLERISDSERNLRRSVCINNTYSRLTNDIRKEKYHKFRQQYNNNNSIDR